MSLSHRLVEETRQAAWRALEQRRMARPDGEEPRHPRRFVSFVLRVGIEVVLSPAPEPLRAALGRKLPPVVDKVAAIVEKRRCQSPDTAVVRIEAGYSPMTLDGTHEVWIRFIVAEA